MPSCYRNCAMAMLTTSIEVNHCYFIFKAIILTFKETSKILGSNTEISFERNAGNALRYLN